MVKFSEILILEELSEETLNYYPAYFDTDLGENYLLSEISVFTTKEGFSHYSVYTSLDGRDFDFLAKKCDSNPCDFKNGEFYSSCGPEIYDFYVNDGKAVIDCSPVKKVRLHSDMHPTRYEIDDEGNITHAEFDIENFWAGPYEYVRISITDKDGKKAWTNPIFLK